MVRPVRTALWLPPLFAAAVGVLVASHGVWWQVPDRHNPFAPLVVADEPNWLTRHKLDRLTNDPALCRAVLQTSGSAATPVPDRDAGGECGWTDSVQLRGSAAIDLASPVVLSCRAAVSFALWAQHVVQPAAIEHLGRSVRRVEHLGSYACRNVNNAPEGRRSRHARAEALDVVGFVLEDRVRISVLHDWPRDDRRAQFLRAAHGGACRWFDGVLGPEYNRLHADHLHLERGPWRACR
jgi:hypothetical protein